MQGWAAGCGIKFKDMTIDLAFRASHDRRYVSRYNTDAPIGGIAATAFGTEALAERSLYLSLIYQLDAETVSKALSWIFIGSGSGS